VARAPTRAPGRTSARATNVTYAPAPPHRTRPDTPAMAATFFSPLKLGAMTLPNRIVLAPLTRCRATPGTCVVKSPSAPRRAAS
jgi:hypothetical protein